MPGDHDQNAHWQDELLPHIVDRLAHDRPTADYAVWVTGPNVVNINYAQLANIVDGLTWWLDDQIGVSKSHEVLTYIGPNDVRYMALVIAGIKTGYLIFLTSPRNSPAAHVALMGRLKSRTLVTSNPVPPPAQVVIEAVKPDRQLMLPAVDELLTKQHRPYEFTKSFQDLRYDPYLVIHSSGSTGLPKPVIGTHESYMRDFQSKVCETPDGTVAVERHLVDGKRVVITLPPFHGAALSQYLYGALPFGRVIITPVAAGIPTAQGVVDTLKHTPADVAILVPSVVGELAQNPELLDYCAAHLQAILYIGGDLPQELGDRVAEKVYLRCLWGSSETGIIPQLLSPELMPSEHSSRKLWKYVRFPPCTGATFDKQVDNTYELVLRRNKPTQDTQSCFAIANLVGADDEEYRTKDLFEPHPTIPDLWCWRARADDIIVFLNGEKTNPISMEQEILASNSDLSGALVVGTHRFQAALLVEPVPDKQPPTTVEQAALIERIWPSVENANRSAPAHARVEKSLILVTSPDRRFVRAGKGTCIRGPSIKQYAEEIDALYANAELAQDEEDPDEDLEFAPGREEITSLVHKHVCNVTGWSDLADGDNFFEKGMDSLQVLQLTRALRRSLRQPEFGLSTVYQSPTVKQLVKILLGGSNGAQDEAKMINDLLQAYRELIQQISKPDSSKKTTATPNAPINVLLTGSTGVVGTHLLRQLLNRQGIGLIFCLNRGQDGGRDAQHKSFVAAGLSATGLDDRIEFVQANLEKPSLGLDEATYQRLSTSIGLVIHAAWPVNFNLSLSAFRPQFAGLVNLLNLTASATSTTRFVFISSVAAIEAYTNGPPPEAILADQPDSAAPLGYGRSKFLGEVLVTEAARHLGAGVSTAIIRVGQVAGPVLRPGPWNPREWFPSMVLSSLHLGLVPDSLGPHFDNVDFVPVDLLADVLIDLAMVPEEGRTSPGSSTVFNVRNPQLAQWQALLPAVVEAGAAIDKSLQVVPPTIWLAALRASGNVQGEATVAQNPALKLVEFFGTLWAAAEAKGSKVSGQPMVVDNALGASPALASLEPIGVDSLRKWVKEWIAAHKE